MWMSLSWIGALVMCLGGVEVETLDWEHIRQHKAAAVASVLGLALFALSFYMVFHG
jgi:hypothetical protein